jgi:hypothetical protein
VSHIEARATIAALDAARASTREVRALGAVN